MWGHGYQQFSHLVNGLIPGKKEKNMGTVWDLPTKYIEHQFQPDLKECEHFEEKQFIQIRNMLVAFFLGIYEYDLNSFFRRLMGWL